MPVIHDPTACGLGEGPLWHPERRELFWFDILGRTLHARNGTETRHWRFDEMVSAAGWVDSDALLIASETRLFRFDLRTGKADTVAPLEDGIRSNRSNDGRADPWGGFWIGTMDKAAGSKAGAIYRFYGGELRRLFDGLSIPNAICFSPDGGFAYFTDTPERIVLRQALRAADGWPLGEPEPWIDLRSEELNPDGAVCDAAGNFWNAQWGAGRIACYDPAGHFQHAIEFPALHTSCPAFGGEHLDTLFCTSARQGLDASEIEAEPRHGLTFAVAGVGPGQAEHRVIL